MWLFSPKYPSHAKHSHHCAGLYWSGRRHKQQWSSTSTWTKNSNSEPRHEEKDQEPKKTGSDIKLISLLINTYYNISYYNIKLYTKCHDVQH